VGPKAIPRRKLDIPRLSAALKELVENDDFRAAAGRLAAQIRSEKASSSYNFALYTSRLGAWIGTLGKFDD
jgi:UDP:flavonoid glycosyltransferase YjiC (YdhE family)